MSFLSRYNPKYALKYDLFENSQYFTLHISYFETKVLKNLNISIRAPISAAYIDIFQFILKGVFDYNTCTVN